MWSRSLILAGLIAMGCKPDTPSEVPGEGGGSSTPNGGAVVTLNNDRMFASLQHLASDGLKGRYTLTPADLGGAADFIAAEYGKLGLKPVGDSFRAPFSLESGHEPGPDLHVWLETPDDVIDVPMERIVSLSTGGGDAVFGRATFVGDATPKSTEGAIAIAVVPDAAATPALRARAKALADAGARAVVLVVPERPSTPDRIDAKIPVVVMEPAEAGPLLASKARVGDEIAGVKISLAAKHIPVRHPSFNMLTWIPGTERPNEIVILGAHFDHIGTSDAGSFCSPKGGDTICNGADDNASGSAMVLEIARSMAESGYQPRRTLVFAHFAGEELGLHGSKALADSPPDAAPFVEGKVVGMINLDMVGRYRESEGLQVGAISSSDQWRGLIDAAGAHGMRLVFERSVTGRSDHANFYRKKIPVLFFFTGLHDDYHGVGDHADKINRVGLNAIGQIVVRVVTAVADGAELQWSEPRTEGEGEVSRLPASDASTVE